MTIKKLKSIDIINVLSDLVSEKLETTVKLPAYPDSAKRTFIVLVDGSFIHIHEGKEVIYGLSYKIEKGKQSLIQEKDCMFTLDS